MGRQASPGLLPSSGNSYSTHDLRRPRETPARPGGRKCARGNSFPFGAKETGAYASSQSAPQRFPLRCNKTKTPSPSEQTSSPSPPLHHRQLLCRRRPPFVRIRCTSYPLSNLAVVGSLLASVIREDDPSHYKWRLGCAIEGDGSETTRAPSRGCSPLYQLIHKPPREAIHQKQE